MAARLLSAMLGILGVLRVQVDTFMVDLDRQKIAGFWREVGVASDQNLVLKAPKRVEGLFLTPSGSNLTVKVAYNNSGSCETESMVGSEIDVAGKFTFPGHREIRVLDTDYERYAILKVSLLWQGRDFHVFKYFTRSLEDEDEPGFWRFRQLTADTGLYLVARQGRCAKLLKERLGLLPHFTDRKTEAHRTGCFAQIQAAWGPDHCPPEPPQAAQVCRAGLALVPLP
ncbi:PREDICTED: epididymal-specific lipocalin-8-like [Galeopterus variegatus]|uniref:Epididymal-specific lipocalin-8-like n=1 Tax=Galeopterus variegatus TaxID=482537 RepID=A0ABM0SHQ7_GALVR|nr:PREDICTED: epididymal-specific lipocalin-8-like [Galeopterus variegatus]